MKIKNILFPKPLFGATMSKAIKEQIPRLFQIMHLIHGKPGITSMAMAKKFHVSERTIFRDLRLLKASGVWIESEPETIGYHLSGAAFLPPVDLTLEEALSLMALAKHIGGARQVPFTRPAIGAFLKIRSLLPGDLRNLLDEFDSRTAIRLASAGPDDECNDVYAHVRDAIMTHKALSCCYESVSSRRSPGSTTETFRFDPYLLFFNQRAWYVAGYHYGRGEVRNLKLSRFSSCRPLRATYKIPEGFTLDKHLGNAWRMIRGRPSYDVVIRFDPAFAETITETIWHKTQTIEWQKGGSILFRCTVDGLEEIVWWVLSMGEHCVVLQPRELAVAVRRHIKGMARHYGRKT